MSSTSTLAAAAEGDVRRHRRDASGPALGPVLRRRVSLPRVLFGAGLILLLAFVGAVIAQRVDTRVPVLATARPVGVGQTITAGDLATVRVAADVGVGTIGADQQASVVGRPAALPLPAGVLLSTAHIGAPVWPPAGQAVLAVPVKTGHAPAGLAPGAAVKVIVVPTTGTAGTAGAVGTPAPAGAGGQVVSAEATVTAVQAAADQSGVTVVSLLMPASEAARVAAATGEPVIVMQAIAGG